MDNSEAGIFKAVERGVDCAESWSGAAPLRKIKSPKATLTLLSNLPPSRNDIGWHDTLPLAQCLRERIAFGHGYRQETLEYKRRQAITWLREQSKTGWTCDRVQVLKNRRDQAAR